MYSDVDLERNYNISPINFTTKSLNIREALCRPFHAQQQVLEIWITHSLNYITVICRLYTMYISAFFPNFAWLSTRSRWVELFLKPNQNLKGLLQLQWYFELPPGRFSVWGSFLGIIDQNRSAFNSNRCYVVIFWFSLLISSIFNRIL